MLSCTRPEMNSGAGSFDAQTAATREPVLGTVYADDFNETDPDSGLTAVHTMQGSKREREPVYGIEPLQYFVTHRTQRILRVQ